MDFLETDEMSRVLLYKYYNSFSTILGKTSKEVKKSTPAAQIGVVDLKKLAKIEVTDPARYIKDFTEERLNKKHRA